MSSLTMESLARRFRACGLRCEEYMPLVKLIDRWRLCTGEEQTVIRLKDFRQLWLHRLAGLPYTCETRIALSSDGVPKGPFSVFFRRRVGKRSMARCWSALMVYTGFVSATVTSRQVQKFLSGVRRDEPTIEQLRPAMDYVALGVKEIQKFPKAPPPEGEDLLDFVPRAAKERSVLRNRTAEVNAVLAEASNLTTWLGSMHSFRDIVRGTLGSVMLPRHERVLSDGEFAGKPVIGHIGVVQEPGFKARFVASPYPAVQQMVNPLHKWLAKVNRQLPGNWQFDQTAGLGFVRDKLRTNGYCCSVDLSGATDHYPLKLQTLVLQLLGVDSQWISAVEILSTALWTTGHLAEPFSKATGRVLYWVSWTTGQPLGLKYSFNLFTLSHWALCKGIQSVCEESHAPDDTEFSIVGDDVTWFCPCCARTYMTVMELMGCPISKAKTLESSQFGEFLSRLITRDQVIPSYKWKAPSDDSFLDIAKCLGPRSLLLFKKRQRKVIRSIAEIPEPFGLGWNPKGLPYWDRYSRIPEDTPFLKEFRLVSAGHHWHKLWYTPERIAGYLGEIQMSPKPTSDQDVVQVLVQCFGEVGRSPILLPHLARDLYGLVSLLSDEFVKYGMLRPEVVKLVPIGLASLLGIKDKPVSAQLATLSLLSGRIKKWAMYAESPERETTLSRYEAILVKMAVAEKGRESQEHRK